MKKDQFLIICILDVVDVVVVLETKSSHDFVFDSK